MTTDPPGPTHRVERPRKFLTPLNPTMRGFLPPSGDWADEGRRGRATRLTPFVLMCLLAYPMAVFVPEAPAHRMTLALSVVLVVATGVQTMLVPWERLPPIVRQLPVATMCLSVVMLREATGGVSSGYGTVLLLLPVVWQALYGRRIDLALTIATVALALVAGLLALKDYPTITEIPRAVLLVLVSLTLGRVVQGLMERVRADDEAMSELGAVSRLLHSSLDPREVLCQSLRHLTGGTLVLLSEPRGDCIALTTVDGDLTAGDAVISPTDAHQALVAHIDEVLGSGLLDFVPGRVMAPRRGGSRAAIASVDIRSTDRLHLPIGPPDSVVGVITVLWAGPGGAPPLGTLRGLSLLSTDAGMAIEKADLVHALADQANRDGLTGIPNRRAWELLLATGIHDSHRAERPLSVALLDLDHFKAYNDRFGHLAGDDLLREAVTAWSGVMRPGDLLARWGGEEFALMFVGATAPNAARALKRLRAVTPDGVSFSAGVTGLEPGDDPDQMMNRADRSMYAAKAAGRDRVVIHEPDHDDVLGPEAQDVTS